MCSQRSTRRVAWLPPAACLVLVILVAVIIPSHSYEYSSRFKKHFSDQHLAEKQAMKALYNSQSNEYGHGQVDPNLVGRRKRIWNPSYFTDDVNDVDDLQDRQREDEDLSSLLKLYQTSLHQRQRRSRRSLLMGLIERNSEVERNVRDRRQFFNN